ncbi:IclR family transcriptional regulator C-terminal domain-containing protein [Corynebacterium sp.]|uniref:IclR family transcriptional regulator domain-containing protein n=1 Tax=Corynebacterium sp. TaxID=1720 RepID=UPI0028ADD213|nr:IclR family transcriptional regulator C-terminal domain-containing protein [Corynebacterium sp.]
MTEPDASPDHGKIQSFLRGLEVIRSFSADNPRQTLSEVATSIGLTRATARRFLHTLVSVGYAGTDGREFWLTPRVLDLGFSFLSSQPLTAIAQPRLEELSRDVGESSSLSVLDGTDVVYVSRVSVRRIMTVGITIGTRFPAYATSMGRMILAGLEEETLDEYLSTSSIQKLTPNAVSSTSQLRRTIATARTQGWCIVDQELEPGLRSVAAPVKDADGATIAAINISTQTAVHDIDAIRRIFLPAVIATARDISDDYAAAHRSIR